MSATNKNRTITKVLVANRGEIAVRVIRSAQALGFDTVAVYSTPDAQMPHVKLADEAICIGPATAAESYLNSDKIIAAAQQVGADAIHPGYGFLSENSGFSNACANAGICFIGPSAAAIELMGNKRLSKIAAQQADVPCVPGYNDISQDKSLLLDQALTMGFPIMIKASAGGGGRGMRLVNNEEEFLKGIEAARLEAQSAFGDGELILEKAIVDARHIEIQVFADTHGNVVYLGERDCSIQRRHQKIVEEAPSPFVDEELRQAMGEAAVRLAKACDYEGAGTVEFLVDADRSFYFLEMNTRLQVEHPVTELVYGVDLVAWQFNTAMGGELPRKQEELMPNGHAIEVRLYAEDPAQQFLPQTGKLARWNKPTSKHIRIDSGFDEGNEISPYYDPMLAKVITHGQNREEARRRLVRGLKEITLFGFKTNLEFLNRTLKDPAFIAGLATTKFLTEEKLTELSQKPQVISDLSMDENELLIKAIAVFALHPIEEKHTGMDIHHWSNSGDFPKSYRILSNDEELNDLQEFTILQNKTIESRALEGRTSDGTPSYNVTQGDLSIELGIQASDSEKIQYLVNGVSRTAFYYGESNNIQIKLDGFYHYLTDYTLTYAELKEKEASGQILATMDGSIVEVLASTGMKVTKGQTLVVLEAMKMEHQLQADGDGVVEAIEVKTGDQVKMNQLLLQVTLSEEDDSEENK